MRRSSRNLEYERRQRKLAVAAGIVRAMALTTVVCNSAPLWWPGKKEICCKCRKEVIVNPLFEMAANKLCISCAPEIPENL